MVLEDFEGVIRDTTRNLRVLEFCRHFAATREDRDAMEPFRPYILMMRTRALAAQAVKEGEPKAALLAIDQGLDELRSWFDLTDRGESFEESNEVQVLRSMRDALTPKLPISQKAEPGSGCERRSTRRTTNSRRSFATNCGCWSRRGRFASRVHTNMLIRQA